jgi:ech hydrogenase subunit A
MDVPLLPPYVVQNGGLVNLYGSFAVLPLCVVAALGFVAAVYAVRRAAAARIVPPYMSGVQTGEPGQFRGPMGHPVKTEARNYYLSSIFGEKRLTTWINLGAFVLLTLIFGGTLG